MSFKSEVPSNESVRAISLQPLYLRYFTNELVGLPRKTKEKDVPKEMDGEFYFFEYGRLTKVMEEL